MYDGIIVGAGAAGLSAAEYLARSGRKTLVIERFFGSGQTGAINEIVNYPGIVKINGYELLEKMKEQALSFGADFLDDEVVKIDCKKKSVTTLIGKEYYARVIIFATGCKSKELGLAGEQALVGRGISYCATCDGGFYKGRNVGVVGNGVKAVADAKYLSALAEKVYLISTASEDVEGVETINGSVTALLGKPLSGVEVVNENGEKHEIELDALFVSVGLNPVTGLLAGQVERDSHGFVITDDDCESSESGVFAVGDIRVKKLRQIVTAAADGAIAATAAIKRIKES